MRIQLLLGLALLLSSRLFAGEPGADSQPQTPTVIWEYIHYSWAGAPSFLVASGEQWGQVSRGLRVDIMEITQGFPFFKTNAISARLYRANGEVVEPTPEGRELLNAPVAVSTMSFPGMEPSPQVMTYFPWGTNALEEAWIEVMVGSERYWLEIPYGFDRNPADPHWLEIPYGFDRNPGDAPSAAVPGGPPQFVPAMKSLTEHDHVERWQSVEYDLGRIQNGWGLSLKLSNLADTGADVLLYQDPDEAIKSPWKTNSPKTNAHIFDSGGTDLVGTYVNTQLNELRFWRTDTFRFDRYENNLRSWGRIEIKVGDKTYQVIVPSSLYKFDHGHAHNPAATRTSKAATNDTSAQLLEKFKNSKVFWRQFEIAREIVALHDTNVLYGLVGWLTNEDRHARGNAAFIFAAMGNDQGFDVIQKILNDRSDRPQGQGVPGGNWAVSAQIAADRYYAVHLFGDLKDPRAVPVLIPLLHDKEVNDIVPWALGQIGDRRAVGPLIGSLNDQNPSLRVLAIYSLEELKAREALPSLRELFSDNDRSDFGSRVSVAEAAGAAITNLETKP